MGLAKVAITGKLLVELLKKGIHESYQVLNGLPPDCEFINIIKDHNVGGMMLILKADKFPEVHNGDEPVKLPAIVSIRKAPKKKEII